MNDLWSRSEDSVKVDTVNTYTTNYQVGTNSTTFVSTRALDTGYANSYVIELDKTI
jgi:hypothetical protein